MTAYLRTSLCLVTILFMALGCKTTDQDLSETKSVGQAEFVDFKVNCPNQSHGLEGLQLVPNRKDKQKAKSAFVLMEQCKKTAAIEYKETLARTRFVCSCLLISAKSDKFSRDEAAKVPANQKSEKQECFRHVHWQSMLTCQWGEDTAKTLGDIREENIDKSKEGLALDSLRDQYHNEYGRMLMASYLKRHDYSLNYSQCDEVSQGIAFNASQKGHCGKFSKESGKTTLSRLSTDKITGEAQSFSQSKAH